MTVAPSEMLAWLEKLRYNKKQMQKWKDYILWHGCADLWVETAVVDLNTPSVGKS